MTQRSGLFDDAPDFSPQAIATEKYIIRKHDRGVFTQQFWYLYLPDGRRFKLGSFKTALSVVVKQLQRPSVEELEAGYEKLAQDSPSAPAHKLSASVPRSEMKPPPASTVATQFVWMLYRDAPASEVLGVFRHLTAAKAYARKLDPEMDRFQSECSSRKHEGPTFYWSGLWRLTQMEVQ